MNNASLVSPSTLQSSSCFLFTGTALVEGDRRSSREQAEDLERQAIARENSISFLLRDDKKGPLLPKAFSTLVVEYLKLYCSFIELWMACDLLAQQNIRKHIVSLDAYFALPLIDPRHQLPNPNASIVRQCGLPVPGDMVDGNRTYHPIMRGQKFCELSVLHYLEEVEDLLDVPKTTFSRHAITLLDPPQNAKQLNYRIKTCFEIRQEGRLITHVEYTGGPPHEGPAAFANVSFDYPGTAERPYVPLSSQ